MTTQDLITRAEFIYKKARRGVRCRGAAARGAAAPLRLSERARAARCVLTRFLPATARPQYQKYSEEKNKDRLLNPGDAFSELCMDFQFQIAALMEVRPACSAAAAATRRPRHRAACAALRRGAGRPRVRRAALRCSCKALRVGSEPWALRAVASFRRAGSADAHAPARVPRCPCRRLRSAPRRPRGSATARRWRR